MKNPIELHKEHKFFEWITGQDLQGNKSKTTFCEAMGLKENEFIPFENISININKVRATGK